MRVRATSAQSGVAILGEEVVARGVVGTAAVRVGRHVFCFDSVVVGGLRIGAEALKLAAPVFPLGVWVEVGSGDDIAEAGRFSGDVCLQDLEESTRQASHQPYTQFLPLPLRIVVPDLPLLCYTFVILMHYGA